MNQSNIRSCAASLEFSRWILLRRTTETAKTCQTCKTSAICCVANPEPTGNGLTARFWEPFLSHQTFFCYWTEQRYYLPFYEILVGRIPIMEYWIFPQPILDSRPPSQSSQSSQSSSSLEFLSSWTMLDRHHRIEVKKKRQKTKNNGIRTKA